MQSIAEIQAVATEHFFDTEPFIAFLESENLELDVAISRFRGGEAA